MGVSVYQQGYLSVSNRGKTMNLEKAIQTAIIYEEKIRDLYRDATDQVKHFSEGSIFETLAEDEAYHASYLEKKLKEWKDTGALSVEPLKRSVPEKGEIKDSVDSLRKKLNKDHRGLVQQLLNSALQVEVETTEFYRKMVGELPESGKKLFEPFLEIEDNHIDAVQFELDYIAGTGYWFGVKEFDME